MARTKQRETYGNGSVTPVMVPKMDKDGHAVIGPNGKPQKVQKKDRKTGQPIWRVCIVLGMEEYIDENGNKRRRPRKVQRNVSGSLDDARKVAKQLTAQYEHVDTSAAKMTFSDACAAWAESMENANKVAPSTLAGYVHLLGLVEQNIGCMGLLDIRESDIDKTIAALRSAGKGSVTVKKAFATTKRVFDFALKREWVVRNPLATMDTPREDKHQTRRALAAEDAARLRAVLDDAERDAMGDFVAKESRMVDWAKQRTHGGDKLWNRGQVRGLSQMSGIFAIRIMLATGCRRGEALALTWGAIDLKAGTLSVNQSLTSQMEIKEPKTRAGVRSMRLDSDTVAHLKAWKAFQASALLRVRVLNADGTTSAIKQTDATPVCCNDAGEWLNYNNLHRWWRAFRDANGFNGLKLHELRHTAATLMLGNGIDIKTVQTRLGHSTSSITLDFYTHAIPANDAAAAELMEKILGAPTKTKADIFSLPDISKTA